MKVGEGQGQLLTVGTPSGYEAAYTVTRTRFPIEIPAEEVERSTAPLTRAPRDPGSYIGNMGRDFAVGNLINGTHNHSLSAEARERRRAKKARYLQNVIARAEDNRNRGRRA